MSDIHQGTYRNPPLAYVVAEMVISPYYSLAAAMPAIQEQLRAAYPRTLEGTEVTIDPASPPNAQKIWQLISPDELRGVSIGSRSVALHSTRYIDSGEFLTAWDEVLAVIDRVLDNVFVERVGLRYIDFIVPSEGRSPLDYVTESVRGIQFPMAGNLESNFWSGTYGSQGSQINARIAAPAPAGMVFPPNFNALPLQKPKIWQQADAHVNTKRKIGFIDTDALQQVNKVFLAATISKLFRELKSQISSTFRVLMSETAKEEWI
jgi:uncharacterized protein (TIGR04255 family)